MANVPYRFYTLLCARSACARDVQSLNEFIKFRQSMFLGCRYVKCILHYVIVIQNASAIWFDKSLIVETVDFYTYILLYVYTLQIMN